MRDISSMALVVTDRDRNAPKVWQPWYIEESEGGGKELPTHAHRSHRMRDRLALPRPAHRSTPSPPGCSSEDEINVVDSPSPPPYPYSYPYTYAFTHALSPSSSSSMDHDGPLDMTTKRRTPPPTHMPSTTSSSSSTSSQSSTTALSALAMTSSPSPPPYHPRPNIVPAHARPSVITCVPTRYLSAQDLQPHDLPPAHDLSPLGGHSRDLPPPYPERPLPPPYSVATAHLTQRAALASGQRPATTPTTVATSTSSSSTSSSSSSSSSPALREARCEEAATSRRQVVQAGPVDPEIDEHFRRSLGKDYLHIFSPAPARPPSSDSVDDHFAKALGETWVKLQAERKEPAPSPLSAAAAAAAAIAPSCPGYIGATASRGSSTVPPASASVPAPVPITLASSSVSITSIPSSASLSLSTSSSSAPSSLTPSSLTSVDLRVTKVSPPPAPSALVTT
ncbi:uncharacterized protein LOC143041009 isoform X2 [Oratosquilla oratoria]|uniref:uncharacterized protein LOC143041009 isoform X2 n=1 Tax=Oratosquilla oratoria TaxID=337810 RepID=UPI003F757758